MQGSVESHEVTFRFGEKLALEDVSFKISSPFYCVVMGPNGAGKTTLLKIMLGLLKPQNGWVKIYGYDPVEHAREVRELTGYVPQIVNIDQRVPITVEELVAMGALSKTIPPRMLTRGIKAVSYTHLTLPTTERV